MLLKYLLFLILCVIYLNSYSQKNKIYTLEDEFDPSYISFEAGIGSGRSFTPIATGFEVDDGSIVTFFPSSGGLFKLSANFFHKSRWTYGLTYSFQTGGLSQLYENGDGTNNRSIITPTIRYAPILYKKGKLNLGVGLNSVLSNYLKITATLPKETQVARYDFKKSYGPTFMIEYQEDFNRWAGGRIGLSYNYMDYELTSFKLNDMELDLSTAPNEIIKYSASSIDYYIAFYVYL